MKKKIKRFFRKLMKVVKKPEMRILPGQLAFFLVLSIIPLAALIAVIAAQFSISIDSLIELVNKTVPSDAAEIISQAIGGKNLNFNITIFYISAFILASNGPYSMIIGSNMLYKVDDAEYFVGRIKALFMTVILVFLFCFMLLVPVFGDSIVGIISQYIEIGYINKVVRISYSILKYPITLFFIFFCIKILYTIAPDKKISSKSTTSGALFTTIVWVISTEIYSFYVEVFAQYNLLYGSIANLIILLLWVYLLSYIFVLGMAINSSSEIKPNRIEDTLTELDKISEIADKI